MKPLRTILATGTVLAAGASTFAFWPIWQEIRTRDADREATAATSAALQNQAIDPAYLETARASGGSVCFAGGDTPEDKTRNLTRCMSALEHRNLLRVENVRLRERCVKLKTSARELGPWAATFLYLTLLYQARRRILASRILFSVTCAAPATFFWLAIGGFPLLFDPQLRLRDGLHFPLFGAASAGVMAFAAFPLTTPAHPRDRVKAWLGCLLAGLLPCAHMILLIGSC